MLGINRRVQNATPAESSTPSIQKRLQASKIEFNLVHIEQWPDLLGIIQHPKAAREGAHRETGTLSNATKSLGREACTENVHERQPFQVAARLRP